MVDDDKLIEDYLAGLLSKEETLGFQQRLKEDTAFSERFKQQKSMYIYLEKEKNKPDLEKQLQALNQSFFSPPSPSKVRPLYRQNWFVGAVIAASILIMLILWNPFKPTDLYRQFADHSPLELVERSQLPDLVREAEKAFNNADYLEAYDRLKTLVENNSEDQKLKLALGISALEIGETSEAIGIFEAIHEGNTLLKSQGTWYLALSYCKEKEYDKARPYLEEIPSAEVYLKRRAQELLQKLKTN